MSNEPLPPLNSLQAYEAAARHESFLKAATEQSVTPGSISRHIRLLENYLGTELFVRRSIGVMLTAAGNLYARKVSRIVGLIARGLDEVGERWLRRRADAIR